MFRLVFFVLVSSLILFIDGIQGLNETHRAFPDGFKFGAATSAYQIEGAWNESDKGENIWDRYVHTTDLVYNGETGDVACDSYNLYERDVEMLNELGVDFYRFSFSWSRILPTGFDNKISEDGVAYYNKLIDLLIANEIQPYVTIYHWDLPQPLQDIGGWANPLMEKYFTDYARVCFEAFGDRVKNWLTLNEPNVFCRYGYGLNDHAPGLNASGIGEYLCGYSLLKAHARAYHLYDDEYRPVQNGRIGLTIHSLWYEPENITSSDDQLASEVGMQFELGWIANSVFSAQGDFPAVMKSNIAAKSAEQGYSSSRLPSFTAEEIEYIKGTSDFFGVNHYTTMLSRFRTDADDVDEHSFLDDIGIYGFYQDDWSSSPSTPWLYVVPWGLKNLLVWIKNTYDNPEIMIFENGYSDLGGTSDDGRQNYYKQYINAVLDAVEEGCNVTAYTAWSLMDNFEWSGGYRQKFGLFSVDFESPDKTRTIKDAGIYYSEIIASNVIERDEI